VAILIIWLEIKLAVFSGLGWFAFGHPSFAVAGVPAFFIGLRIIWVLLTREPGPESNRLLALAAFQLVLFATLFQLIAKTNF
jgi:hypothetical protein